MRLNAQTNQMQNLLGNTNSPYSGFLQSVWDAAVTTTNAAIVAGGGHSLKGKNTMAFGAYFYNMNNNAALMLAYDDIWSGPKHQASVLRGGIRLNERLYPFQKFGITGFYTTLYAFDAVATPLNGTSNNGGLANVAGTGADFNWDLYQHKLLLHLGAFYENRSGQGWADGNYLGGYAGLSYGNRGAYGN